MFAQRLLLFFMLSPAIYGLTDLSGEWRFALDPEDEGLSERWYQKTLSGSIELPATTTTAGKGEDQEGRLSLDAENLRHLLQQNRYVGAAWYQRDFELPEDWSEIGSVELSLERVLWESRVWINGHPVGAERSLSTPHRFEVGSHLMAGSNTITIRIDNRKLLPVGVIGHGYTEETQTVWNGILGEITLKNRGKLYLSDLNVRPDIGKDGVWMKFNVVNRTGRLREVKLGASAIPKTGEGSALDGGSWNLSIPTGTSSWTLFAQLGKGYEYWSEFNPVVYSFEVRMMCDEKSSTASTDFGMRRMEAAGNQILLNNVPVFLRGNLECAIFPRTGHPDVDGEEWMRIFQVAREWGLNHFRFHSWTPPRAAFEAADQMGFYLQVEPPNWTFNNGHNPELDKFFLEEAKRIIAEFGNHPSFVMLSLGNELDGDFGYLDSVIVRLREIQPDLLYTSTSYTFAERGTVPGPQDDFFISQRTSSGWVRGQGFINSTEPTTDSDYAEGLSSVTMPLITHEIGQYVVYPDLRDLDLYEDSPMRNIAYESIRVDLAEKGRLHEAAAYTAASGQLAAILYKEDIERALRTKGLAGFQLLQLHDFPGQSTATVGLLNPFWKSKGIIEAEAFRNFNGPTVPLLRLPKKTFRASEMFNGKLEVAHFGSKPLPSGEVTWKLKHGERVVRSGVIDYSGIALGNGHYIGEIAFDFEEIPSPAELSLVVEIGQTESRNEWRIWVYPERLNKKELIRIVNDMGPDTLEALKAGETILLIPSPSTIQQPIRGRFIPVFWSPVHFANQPGTLGALIDEKHPVFKSFPTRYHTDWQWWELLSESIAVDLDVLDVTLDMPFRFIDKFNRNALPAGIFEFGFEQGKALVCTLDIESDLENRIVAAQLRESIIEYMESELFNPQNTLSQSELDQLFGLPRFEVLTNSQHPDYPASNILDGNTNTFWHSDWNHDHGPPFQLEIILPEHRSVQGLIYTPRQDSSNGRITRYSIEVLEYDNQWKPITENGLLSGDDQTTLIRFPEPLEVERIRMVIHESHAGRAIASAAALIPLFGEDEADVRDLGIIEGFNE